MVRSFEIDAAPPRNGAAVQQDRLCVICPCYNEQAVLPRFHQALRSVLTTLIDVQAQIIFIDDGSADGTLDLLNTIADHDPDVRVYSLSRNFGHQIALSAGLDVADADAVIMMDCDLQHPPSLIPQMIEAWRQGFDVVSAVRQRTEHITFWKNLSSRAFYLLMNWCSDVPIRDGAADFCLLSRRAHQSLCNMPERHRFLRGLIAWIGFRRTYIPYTASARAAGDSKYHWRAMCSLAAGAAISFSVTPMRFAIYCGLLTATLGVIYGMYIFTRALQGADEFVPGWASVMCVILFLSGAQLLFIGIVGSYIGRIFEQVKGRPLYLFKQAPLIDTNAIAPLTPESDARLSLDRT